MTAPCHSIPPFRRLRWGRSTSPALVLAALVSAAMAFGGGGSRVAQAAPEAGEATIVVPPAGAPLTSGGSATPFALSVPVGAGCSGDTVSGEYLIQSYMVPAGVDPAALTFDTSGPIPLGVGADLRQPLFAAIGGSPFVNGATALATTPGGPGLITGLPEFSFAVFGADGPSIVPPGAYNLGIACTKGLASATQLDRYWNVRVTFAVDAADAPAGITWTVDDAPPTTTTTTTTEPGSSTTTSTTTTTTTTEPGSTTSTSSTTPSTTIGSSSTGGGTTGGGGSTGGRLPTTGSGTAATVFWAIVLLLVGRIVVLVARRPRVITDR